MARFLVAWEFGEGLGHVRRVLPIGRALRDRGHEVAIAFRDATMLADAASQGFAAWPAPLLRRPAAIDPAPVSAADVLLNLGFRDVGALAGALRGWHALIDAVRPDVLVADYAPVAMVAARTRGLRRATVGSGFALPRAGDPTPAMRGGPRTDGASLARIDRTLAAAVGEATADAGAWRTVRALFEGDLDLLTTLPELDPFGPRDAQYVGAIHAESGGLEVEWPRGDAPAILAYLKPHDPRFAAMLAALQSVDARAVVAAPRMRGVVEPSSPHIALHGAALRLDRLLPRARLAVGHGGAGFAAAALLAGVPLALLPLHFEQELAARRLAQQGLAVLLDAGAGAASLRQGLVDALADDSMLARARAFAQRHAGARANDAAASAAAHLERLAT